VVSAQKIAMTVPVATKVDPMDDDKLKFTMGFYVPKEFQENTPTPTDPEVKISDRHFKVYTT